MNLGRMQSFTFRQRFFLCLLVVIAVDILWDLRRFMAIEISAIKWWEPLVLVAYWVGSAIFFAVPFHFVFRRQSELDERSKST